MVDKNNSNKVILMRIATILFTYARPKHTRRTLDALEKNTLHPTKLYIFQDGMNAKTDVDDWNSVSDIIKNISWSNTEVYISNVNKGLAESIVWGISRVLEENDAVIVLEDDCVTHPQFMEYMLGCLEKYANEEKVFSVNGFSWPVDVEANGYDAFFMGRTSSWGWATWKNRWKLYEEDYLLLKKIKNNEVSREQFEIWGQDLESYLKGNIDGKCNSWATFWALQCIKRGGFCPTPYESLIINIGFDGSGVHCGTGKLNIRTRAKDNLSELKLPEHIAFPKNYETTFRDVFHYTLPEVKLRVYNQILFKWLKLRQEGKCIGDHLQREYIQNVSIWGKGDICKLLISELKGEINICSIIESQPNTKSYQGIKVISAEEIPDEVQLIIVIPIYDYDLVSQKINGKIKLRGIDKILDDIEMEKF